MRREQTRAQRSRLRVLEAALASFAASGFERTTFQDVAARAGVSVGLACRYFPTKEHLALGLYTRLADDLSAWAAAEMPAGSVAARFEATMRAKLELLAPHRKALAALAARALNPEGRAAVLGPGTEVVRSSVAGVFALVVRGAEDAPPGEHAATLARLLYAVHLVVVLLYVQDAGDGRVARETMNLAKTGLGSLGPMLPLLAGSPLGARLDSLLAELFGTSKLAAPGQTARIVCDRIFRRRRVLPGVPREPTEAALSLHLPLVQGFVAAGEPIALVLPAFPAKAPNPGKVLGKRPDTAEWLALESLSGLLDELREAHAPGAELVICSDGGVFADAVGVSDRDVATYRADLAAMIAELGVARGAIRIWGLDDAFGDVGPAAARKLLMTRWAPSNQRGPRARRGLARGGRAARRDPPLPLRGRARPPPGRVAHAGSKVDAGARVRGRAQERGVGAPGVGGVPGRRAPVESTPSPRSRTRSASTCCRPRTRGSRPGTAWRCSKPNRFRLMRRLEAAEIGARVVEEDGRPSHMEVPP